MGKQINFYMDDKIKQDFINFLDAEGYVFLPDSSFDILFYEYYRKDNYIFIIHIIKRKYSVLFLRKSPSCNIFAARTR